MKVYNKLIRDRIPDIMAQNGEQAHFSILNDEDYLRELDKKLTEETAEYQESKELEELADILEVLEAICTARGHSVEELYAVRSKKRAERGGFEKRLFLEYKE